MHYLFQQKVATKKERKNETQKKIVSLYLVKGRIMAQAVSRWPLIAEAQIRVRVNACGISGGQRGTETDFSPSFSVYHCHYHSTMALHVHISSACG
jgi:hypothetical protein